MLVETLIIGNWELDIGHRKLRIGGRDKEGNNAKLQATHNEQQQN
jgi:hypothetical protein